MWLPLPLCCPFVTWYLINPPVPLSLSKESCTPLVFSSHRANFMLLWLWRCVKVARIHETSARYHRQLAGSNKMGVEINFSITSAFAVAAAIIRSSEVQKGERWGERAKKRFIYSHNSHQQRARGSISIETDSNTITKGQVLRQGSYKIMVDMIWAKRRTLACVSRIVQPWDYLMAHLWIFGRYPKFSFI